MRYTNFKIENYKAVKTATLDLTSEGLVLLLGINESGKTSVLRAVESFDYTNDPAEEEAKLRFYKSIRNKRELNSEAQVTARIQIDRGDKGTLKEIILEILGESAQSIDLNGIDHIEIARRFSYKNAEFEKVTYTIEGVLAEKIDTSDSAKIDELCKHILKICPSIQYFEDFKDQIPEFISMEAGVQYYDVDWASTIEGLFYHADPSVSVEQFQSLTDSNARQTILNKVNLALNKQFTNRWNKQLKGTKSISAAKLEYTPDTKLFTFQIIGSDKATVFSIEERSKGALWYFTFLLKTEFRKKKLRAELGKTLYLIDEPGSNLHSTAQTNMVVDFRTLASDSNVIYTTHSQYLIDKENLQNVYIVSFSRNTVNVEKYSNYLQGKKIKTSYYQPIIDALEIQPFSLDISWNKVLLVEGIYDYCGFKLLFERVLGKKLDFVIIPGTSASNLSTLISLHVGWGAQLAVLLDDDDEGRNQKDRYDKYFPSLVQNIDTLSFVNTQSIKEFDFEQLFTSEERKKIVELCNMGTEITKSQFQQSLALCLNNENLAKKLKPILTQETKNQFAQIFDKITKILETN